MPKVQSLIVRGMYASFTTRLDTSRHIAKIIGAKYDLHNSCADPTIILTVLKKVCNGFDMVAILSCSVLSSYVSCNSP